MTEENQGQDAFDGAVERSESPEVAELDTATGVEELAEEEDTVDDWTALSAELQEVKAQAAEYLDGWQRARAEFVNYRRREEQQKKQTEVAVKSRVLTQLLPVIDDLERAFEAVPVDIEDNPWVNGLSLVGHKWLTSLSRVGLSVLPVQPGDAFDPSYHEALTHEPHSDFDEGAIIQIVQRGYKLDDVVLRPALVRVSSGKIETD